MRKLRRAPRPGEKSRNLGVRLSQKARADPAGPRTRSQRSHVPGPSPWLRAPAPARVRRHGEQNTARKPTPQRAGAGPGLSACPRGRDGPPGLTPAGVASAASRPCHPLPAHSRAAHSPGPSTPSGCPRGTWLARSSSPSVRPTPRTFLYCARARVVWSPAKPGIRAEPAGVPLLRPVQRAFVDGRD
ncbi:uncharacterized protein C17orf114 homolog isoform X1 [Chionomys nivalis]|uniref:uncharacterized protein C17orf114 homolog isoform X1 n=1 Tax=Chionomys nivalis TaxID=269649 RepID=UPI002599F0B2|nr:uncharacterized protein C17orf114 homolog isoform X1 [Chionomys nivalis]